MGRLAAALGLLLIGAGISRAPERVPREEAKRIANRLADRAKAVDDLPIRVEVDPEKPYGLRSGELGAMVIPDKALAEKAIARPGAGVTPVGQLWLKGLAPARGGEPTPDSQLLLVTITVKDEAIVLPLCLLGVRPRPGGDPELVVYGKGKGKEPLLALPLLKIEAAQELPIELDGRKVDGDAGELTLRILGRYRARLTVMNR